MTPRKQPAITFATQRLHDIEGRHRVDVICDGFPRGAVWLTTDEADAIEAMVASHAECVAALKEEIKWLLNVESDSICRHTRIGAGTRLRELRAALANKAEPGA